MKATISLIKGDGIGVDVSEAADEAKFRFRLYAEFQEDQWRQGK